MSRVFVHLTYLCCIFIFGISSLNWNEVKVTQFCLTLCSPMDYTVHGVLQVRMLEWVAFPFSRESSQPKDWTQVSYIAGRFFTSWATGANPNPIGCCLFKKRKCTYRLTQGEDSRLQSRREASRKQLCWHLHLLISDEFLWFKPPSLQYLVTAAPENEVFNHPGLSWRPNGTTSESTYSLITDAQTSASMRQCQIKSWRQSFAWSRK